MKHHHIFVRLLALSFKPNRSMTPQTSLRHQPELFARFALIAILTCSGSDLKIVVRRAVDLAQGKRTFGKFDLLLSPFHFAWNYFSLADDLFSVNGEAYARQNFNMCWMAAHAKTVVGRVDDDAPADHSFDLSSEACSMLEWGIFVISIIYKHYNIPPLLLILNHLCVTFIVYKHYNVPPLLLIPHHYESPPHLRGLLHLRISSMTKV